LAENRPIGYGPPAPPFAANCQIVILDCLLHRSGSFSISNFHATRSHPMSGSPLSPACEARHWGWTQTAIAAGLVIGAGLALSVDVPLAQWLRSDPPLPKAFVRLTTWAEAFANAIGVAVFILAVYVLDPTSRVAVPRLMAASWGAGLAADVVKLTIERTRPREFDYVGGVWDTFGPLINIGAGTGHQSFPSAHSAVAVGLAIGLSWRYPRGRWLFAGLAALACMQRLVSVSHFLSDVLSGATIGYLVGWACIGQTRLGQMFDRLECRLRR
jgi:membrane-associated phospholipid phosphatase